MIGLTRVKVIVIIGVEVNSINWFFLLFCLQRDDGTIFVGRVVSHICERIWFSIDALKGFAIWVERNI